MLALTIVETTSSPTPIAEHVMLAQPTVNRALTTITVWPAPLVSPTSTESVSPNQSALELSSLTTQLVSTHAQAELTLATEDVSEAA